MGQFMSQPTSDKSLTSHKDQRFSYAIGAMQGYRLTQEDAHLVHYYRSVEFQNIENKTKMLDVKIYAIFDGHGGDESSKFLSCNLSGYVMDELTKAETPEVLGRFSTDEALIIHKLQNSFLSADHQLYRHLHNTHHQHHQHGGKVHNKGSKKNNSGSTAIMAVIINNEDLYTVNLGDSRLILSYDGYAKNLSFDHKPNHIGELIRINDANGSVSYNRVGGVLALSRAFGDFNFKLRQIYNHNYVGPESSSQPNSNSSSEWDLNSNKSYVNPHILNLSSDSTQVTAYPEITLYKLNKHVEFMVLACDGVYDVFSNQDLISSIRKGLAKGRDLEGCIEAILEEGLKRADEISGRGFDNMSMIVITVQMGKEGKTITGVKKRDSKVVVKSEKTEDSSLDGDHSQDDPANFYGANPEELSENEVNKLHIAAHSGELSQNGVATRSSADDHYDDSYEETETLEEWKERIREKVKAEFRI